MNQYDKAAIAKHITQFGYRKVKDAFEKPLRKWTRRIWVQSGVRSMAGKVTINFELAHPTILETIQPSVAHGKGHYVALMRIGELLGIPDKWYSSITPSYIEQTTSEMASDISLAIPKYECIDSDEQIAKYLWDRKMFPISMYVMALYLDKEQVRTILGKLEVSGTIRDNIEKILLLSDNLGSPTDA
jgi:hypothetical protein